MTFCPIPPFQFQRSLWFTGVGRGGRKPSLCNPPRLGDCSCSFSQYLSITVYAPVNYVPRTQKNPASPLPKWSSQSQEQRGRDSLHTLIQPTEPWRAWQMSRGCQQFVGNKLLTFVNEFICKWEWLEGCAYDDTFTHWEFLNLEKMKYRKLNVSVGMPMEWGCHAQGHGRVQTGNIRVQMRNKSRTSAKKILSLSLYLV